MKSYRKQQRGPKHIWVIIGSVAAILIITLFGVIPKAYRGKDWDSEKAGQFGDFIGGYFGTVFLVISVAVLIVSYRNQRFANQVTAFESRFFELFQYHRDNTIEIEVDSIKGRRAFVFFLREWRMLTNLVKAAESALSIQLDATERAVLSYLAFYHGSGPNARRSFQQEACRKNYSLELVAKLLDLMSEEWSHYNEKKKENQLGYVPFGGHHSRLAHYFRHLFHVVKYSANHAPGETAQEYADLVRAQLTTHEQAILALHAASVDGAWRTQSYLQDFHMIKNVPRCFLRDEEFPIRKIFPKVGYADSDD